MTSGAEQFQMPDERPATGQLGSYIWVDVKLDSSKHLCIVFVERIDWRKGDARTISSIILPCVEKRLQCNRMDKHVHR